MHNRGILIFLTWRLALTVLIAADGTPQFSSQANPTCAALLRGLASNPKETQLRVDQVKSQLAALADPDIVVYAAVPNETGMGILRMESTGKGKDIMSETVGQSPMTDATFRRAIAAVRQPNNFYYHRILRDELPLPNKDQGKLVLFMDADRYGFTPETFEYPDAVLLGSEKLETALHNIKRLETEDHAKGSFAGIFGFPRTSEEYLKVFGSQSDGQTFGPLDTWIDHFHTATDTAARRDVQVLSPSSKDEALKMFGEQDGIIAIVIHADGAEMRIPGKKAITLTPSDIAKAHFAKSPFIFLRMCQPTDSGFGEAFLKAGASGVWMNRDTIEASDALKEADEFMRLVRSGLPIRQAIKQIMQKNPNSRLRTLLLAEQH